MAIVTAPLMSAEARGRVGGLIYNTYRGMATVKAKTAPTQPRTAVQLDRRARGIQFARAWQGLDAPERAAWNAYAVAHQEVNWTGNPVRLTGMNWFLRINTRLALAAQPTLDVPPSVPAPDPVTALSATGGVAQIVITWTDPATFTGELFLWLAGPHSPGRSPRFPGRRFRGGTSITTGTRTVTGLQPGTYDVWVTSFDVDTGLISVYQLDTTAVT